MTQWHNVSSLFQRFSGSIHYMHTHKKNSRSQNGVWVENGQKKKIKYAKINSKIISDAKYILLFHISSWYVRFVFLNRCQLKEINSTCIIFEEKSNFLKKLWKILTCRLKMNAIFGLSAKKYARKRYPCLCFITPCFLDQRLYE